jgi:hypothetical protein
MERDIMLLLINKTNINDIEYEINKCNKWIEYLKGEIKISERDLKESGDKNIKIVLESDKKYLRYYLDMRRDLKERERIIKRSV